MNRSEPPDLIASRLPVMRIILVALCLGVAMFAAIAVFLRSQRPAREAGQPIIQYVAILFTVAAGGAALVVPGLATAGWRQQQGRALLAEEANEGDGLSAAFTAGALGAYQTQMLVGAALLEGAAFFNLIAYLIEGAPLNLGLALGLLVFMLTKLPSRLGIERWLNRQREQAEQEAARLP